MIKILRNRKGVTLVELLAVVVILGIIAAIAVPTIGGLIRRQEENAAQATYDTVVAAAKLYAEDTTPFTLASLDPDFVDLKDNVFGLGSATTVSNAQIWIVVTGNTIAFYAESDIDNPTTAPALASGATAVELWVEGYDIEE